MAAHRKKIGIMGGTFDPVHVGHLILGEKAYEQLGLDSVWFMPSGNPPHKRNRQGRASNEERISMVQKAIEGNPHFELSLIEMNEDGYTYTYRTLERLRQQNPDTDYYFIIGADSLMAIETWVHPERIFPTCTILATYRDEIKTKEEMDQQIHHLSEKYGAQVLLMETPLMPVSSHELRASLQAGESVSAYVPDAVCGYIKEHQLYR